MTPPTETPKKEETRVTVRLRSHERIIPYIIAALVLAFYGSPFVFQAAFNRRPPESLVREQAIRQLPSSFRIGNMYDVRSIDPTFSRRGSTTWTDTLVGSGDWSIEAKIALRPKSDLFEKDDFAAHARAAGDDPARLAVTIRQAKRFASAVPLPELPAMPPLYSRHPADKAEENTTVKLTLSRWSRAWLGISPAACLKCWESITDENHGWRDSGLPLPTPPLSLPVPEAPRKSVKFITRQELPAGALIADDPATAQAIQSYVVKRRSFIAAVEKRIPEENAAQFELAARHRLVEDVASRFTPRSAYAVDAIRFERPSEPTPDGGTFTVGADMSVSATDDILVSASLGDAAAESSAIEATVEAARNDAVKYLGGPRRLPAPPRLYKVVTAKGSAQTVHVGIDVKNDAGLWEIVGIHWPNDQPNLAPAGAVMRGGLSPADTIIGSPEYSATLRAYSDIREGFVAEIQKWLAALEKRWGADRSAWEVIVRAIEAHGGQAALDGFRSYEREWTVRQTQAGATSEYRLTDSFEFPNRYRADIQADGGRTTIVFTGTSNWVQSPSQRIDPPSDELTSELDAQIFVEHILLFLGRRDADPMTLTRLPDETPDGRDCAVIKVSTSRCADLVLFFDKTSGLLAGSAYQVARDAKNVPHTDRFEFSKGTFLPKRSYFTAGAVIADSRLRSYRAVSSATPGTFRNPLIGRPFVPDGQNLRIQMTFSNEAAKKLSLYIDDRESPVAITGHYRGETILLQSGEHEITALAEDIDGDPNRQLHARCRIRLPLRSPATNMISVKVRGDRLVIFLQTPNGEYPLD